VALPSRQIIFKRILALNLQSEFASIFGKYSKFEGIMCSIYMKNSQPGEEQLRRLSSSLFAWS